MKRLIRKIRRPVEVPQRREVRRRMRSSAPLRALGSILTLTSPPRRKKPNPSRVRFVARSTADFWRLTRSPRRRSTECWRPAFARSLAPKITALDKDLDESVATSWG